MSVSEQRPSNSPHVLKYVLEHGQITKLGSKLSLLIPRGDPAVDNALSRYTQLDMESLSAGPWFLEGVAALDFVGALLDDPKLAFLAQGSELAKTYAQVIQELPVWDAAQHNAVRVQKLCDEAVVPSKERVSDSGYDLTIIAVRKHYGTVTLFGTGLVVEPPDGYYFDVVARSSIIKTGHMLANNVGIIDRAYRGELMIPVVKIDPQAPDLSLPLRLAQLIPRPIVHFPVEKVEQVAYTSRGSGGFGSTG